MSLDKCISTPSVCGCSICSIYVVYPFAKKVLGLIYNGTQQSFLGWVWKDESIQEITKVLAAIKLTSKKCESTEEFCGC